MNVCNRYFIVTLISLSIFSCKNEVNDPSRSTSESKPENGEVTIEANPELRNIMVNSIMLKSMITPELKTYSSMLVSAGLGDLLSNDKGPFTLIAPSNDAFGGLGQLEIKDLLNATNKDDLARLIKSHIIEGDLNTKILNQKIEEGKGRFEVTSMSGESYVISRKGTQILITNQNGVSAQILEGEVKGINGIVHTIDKVIGVIN